MRKTGRTKKEIGPSLDTESTERLEPSGVSIEAKNGGYYVYLGVSLMAITATHEAATEAANKLR